MSDHDTQFDRACAALCGMAIGDALGMPSQTLSTCDIQKHYGTITDFVAPFPDHPVSHGLAAATVTDDTEQAFLLAHRLIADGGQINDTTWAQDLLGWEADIRARGLRDLLGPSSKLALARILDGAPASETGKAGTTNGAAMRIAPIGIATNTNPLPAFLDRVEMACRMTHNTGEAIAAAAAVAAVISCGINGDSFDDAIPMALRAAEAGQARGYAVGDTDIAGRIRHALAVATSDVPIAEFAAQVGTSVNSHESIPAAFGVVMRARGDVWQATLIAANIGDDTDTIGAIAGAMAGACSGLQGMDPHKIDRIRAANDLPVEAVATRLLALRDASAPATDQNMQIAP